MLARAGRLADSLKEQIPEAAIFRDVETSIPAAGGLVTVERTAGRQLYTGSGRNGIRSGDYGAYSDSIRFQARYPS